MVPFMHGVGGVATFFHFNLLCMNRGLILIHDGGVTVMHAGMCIPGA